MILIEGDEIAQCAGADLELLGDGLIAACTGKIGGHGIDALLVGQFSLSHGKASFSSIVCGRLTLYIEDNALLKYIQI